MFSVSQTLVGAPSRGAMIEGLRKNKRKKNKKIIVFP